MNDYDRENLTFLLTSTPEELREWYNTVDENDHEYASELMLRYSEELAVHAALNEDEVMNNNDAIEYLKKFLVKK